MRSDRGPGPGRVLIRAHGDLEQLIEPPAERDQREAHDGVGAHRRLARLALHLGPDPDGKERRAGPDVEREERHGRSKQDRPDAALPRRLRRRLSHFYRGDWIRTSENLSAPNRALYQTELRPVNGRV